MDDLHMDNRGLCIWVQNRYPSGTSNIVPDEITRFPVVSRAPLQVRSTMSITFGHATVKRLECEREMAKRLNHLRLGFPYDDFSSAYSDV